MSLLGRIFGIQKQREPLGDKQMRILKKEEEKLSVLDSLGQLTGNAVRVYEKLINECRNQGYDTDIPETKLNNYKNKLKKQKK